MKIEDEGSIVGWLLWIELLQEFMNSKGCCSLALSRERLSPLMLLMCVLWRQGILPSRQSKDILLEELVTYCEGDVPRRICHAWIIRENILIPQKDCFIVTWTDSSDSGSCHIAWGACKS